jgi:hypothetical protein
MLRSCATRVLPDLGAHEEKLLAGMRPHVREERAQVRKTVATRRRASGEQRTLSVHDLVVRERQHEILGPGVEEPNVSRLW